MKKRKAKFRVGQVVAQSNRFDDWMFGRIWGIEHTQLGTVKYRIGMSVVYAPSPSARKEADARSIPVFDCASLCRRHGSVD